MSHVPGGLTASRLATEDAGEVGFCPERGSPGGHTTESLRAKTRSGTGGPSSLQTPEGRPMTNAHGGANTVTAPVLTAIEKEESSEASPTETVIFF